MLDTIVVGVDAGAEGRAPVVLARELADAAGARLLLVHAYPYDLLPLEGTVTEVTVAEEIHDDARRLTAAIRDELAPDAEVRVLPDTSPARALHEVCVEERAALLVVGHGRGHTVRGAVHHAPCPVLVAPRDGDAEPSGVEAVDGAPPEAAELARWVAGRIGARVLLVVASTRLGPLDRLLRGDAEDRAVRDAACAVLVVPRAG
jgi:nucleotide-binding universal stress UspA family protein